MRIGTKVRMSEKFKKKMIATGSGEHIAEFGEEVGIVVKKPDNVKDWPEVQVEWGDTGLRYLYDPEELDKVETENT